MLEIEGGPFIPAPTKDALTIKQGQRVFVFGWSRYIEGYEETDNNRQSIFGDLFFTETKAVTNLISQDSPLMFGIDYPAKTPVEERRGIAPTKVVTDSRGNVLGFVGNSYWGLGATPTIIGWLPPVVSINSGLALLSENASQQIWTRGPVGFILTEHNSNTAYKQAPPTYNEIAAEIEKVLNSVGEPLPLAELQVEDYTSFYPANGKAITTVYALPVILKNTDGNLVAQAKWVFIRWGVPGQPDYIIYGTVPYVPGGAFAIEHDVTNLDKFFQPPIFPIPNMNV